MKAYQRPMAGWWHRNPFYLWYTLRELSSLAVTAYALVLLAGLARLRQGEAQFDAWREALASPAWLGFHAVALLLVLYHAWTWFKVMPKTLPFLRVAGRRVPDRAIVAAGLASAVLFSIILFVAVRA
jgi:fumarate reductase subunit C